MFYLMLRSLAIILFKICFRLEAFGRENIPASGGFILASNHASYLDPPVLGAASPRVLHYVAKEELFNHVLFARFLTALNVFPIKSRSADLASLRRAIKELEQGNAVTIFPEGRRTPDGQLDQPLQGVGFLAAKTKVPIVPAFIQGSHRALPVRSKFIRLKKIKVYFGRVIRPQDYEEKLWGKELYQKITETTMGEISRLKELSEKI